MTYEVLPLQDIRELKELWEQLNALHLKDSVHFKEHFRNQSFEERCAKFLKLSPEDVYILLLRDKNRKLGYCISTACQGSGEIDSLFVDESCRQCGYGKELAERSIRWLEEKGCDKISAAVAGGHESVFGFYETLGFYPRLTYLRRKYQIPGNGFRASGTTAVNQIQPKVRKGRSGGIFIGRNIRTGSVRNRYCTIILSPEAELALWIQESSELKAKAVFIPPNTRFRLETPRNQAAYFIHIDPYSLPGLELRGSRRIETLPEDWLQSVHPILEDSLKEDGTPGEIEKMIGDIVRYLPESIKAGTTPDSRILECLMILNSGPPLSVRELASMVALSPSRLSHLFKEETGLTLRQYRQHRKMVKAISGFHDLHNLTEAAYSGGFSDQAHFSNVFKKMFGIKPSQTRD